MKHDERVKFKFDKLAIGSYDLLLGERTPRMLLHLYYLFISNEVVIMQSLNSTFERL